MVRNARLSLLACACALALWMHGTSDGQAARGTKDLTGTLLVVGSSTMTPLMTEIARRFEARHPGVTVDVQGGGSGRGLADVRHGKADIGMVSRALTDKEDDVYGYPIARDGVAVIINQRNPVKALSDAQVSAIYRGKIANWKEVGGRDAPIFLIVGDAERGASEVFSRYFNLRYAAIKFQAEHGDNLARIQAVTAHPNGIAYMSVGEAERNARAGAPVKLLPIGGVAASHRTIRSGNYPIARPLTLVTKGLPKGLAKEFVKFSLSAQVTETIERHDFVSYQD